VGDAYPFVGSPLTRLTEGSGLYLGSTREAGKVDRW
jgi:hypothetical protein